jgi:hypothetical protein
MFLPLSSNTQVVNDAPVFQLENRTTQQQTGIKQPLNNNYVEPPNNMLYPEGIF